MVIVYLGALFILLLNAFWAKDPFTGKVEPFNWSLAAFETIIKNPVYTTIAVRTVSMAVLVTITDALLAIPIAYYMARIASPARRRLLVVAVLIPLWAAYLVKVYAWRIILQGNGLLDWAIAPLGLHGPGLSDIMQHVDRAQLPVAAVHDPAALRRLRANSELAARSVVRPGRRAASRRSGGSSCRSSFRHSSRARSSPSR